MIDSKIYKGDTVLDFTMGSGTTCLACKRLNRNFIGIEKEEKYYEIAKKRLEENTDIIKNNITSNKRKGYFNMTKDWVGNKASTFKMIAATNHAPEGYEREKRDYYATEPRAAELLLQVEPDLTNIWENAAGQCHLANVFEKYGKLGRKSDIINRDNDPNMEVRDFLATSSGLFDKKEIWDGDIVTNPPYSMAQEFVEQSIKTVTEGHKVCMFLKLTFLEGQSRREMYKKYPPKVIYVCSGRMTCAMNGEFEIEDKKTGKMKPIGSAVCYAWFVWQKGFKGDPIIKWIN